MPQKQQSWTPGFQRETSPVETVQSGGLSWGAGAGVEWEPGPGESWVLQEMERHSWSRAWEEPRRGAGRGQHLGIGA